MQKNSVALISEREKDVVRLLAEHKTVDEIAVALGIKKRTVHFHLQNVYKKCGYESHKRNQTLLVVDWLSMRL